jgi:hypothetical protein
MSEEKIIHHTKKAIAVLHNQDTIIEKIKDFFGEIIIIIIAVSITLAFHNWNEERHEKEIARDFLTGISADLKASAANLKKSVTQYQPTIDYYEHVWKQMNYGKIDAKYVDTSSGFLRNTNYFVFDDSRFEGFKSSGYLRLIKNDTLLKKLVTLYSIAMPFERDADINFFHSRAEDFNKYIGINADIDASGNIMVAKLLTQRPVRFHIYHYMDVLEERKRHKQDLAIHLLKVAAEIDKDLKE